MRSTEASAKVVCFSGCWVMLIYFSSILVGSCLPAYIPLLILLVRKVSCYPSFACTVLLFCIKFSQYIRMVLLLLAYWTSQRIFSFLLFPVLSQDSQQLSPDTLNFFFLFETHKRNKKTCLQMGLLSVKDWRWLCCSTDV